MSRKLAAVASARSLGVSFAQLSLLYSYSGSSRAIKKLCWDGEVVLDKKVHTKGPQSVDFSQPGIHRDPQADPGARPSHDRRFDGPRRRLDDRKGLFSHGEG